MKLAGKKTVRDRARQLVSTIQYTHSTYLLTDLKYHTSNLFYSKNNKKFQAAKTFLSTI